MLEARDVLPIQTVKGLQLLLPVAVLLIGDDPRTTERASLPLF